MICSEQEDIKMTSGKKTKKLSSPSKRDVRQKEKNVESKSESRQEEEGMDAITEAITCSREHGNNAGMRPSFELYDDAMRGAPARNVDKDKTGIEREREE